ncbi:hypothetical protein QYF61_027722 [Mycteria americana]|uniref:Uncharacterized protein n=1 Tax=Mycteria americana TaxID=33587 RepID=A0AAN7SAK9_MYCAM|nr:hypothetical protein QYF61_027722 [Mycteria americana]
MGRAGRDREGIQGGGVVLYVREGLDCTVLAAGNDTVESPCVRMKGKENKADVVVGVYLDPRLHLQGHY